MDATTILASALLVVCFGLSGWAKLDEAAQTQATARAFGLPSWLAVIVGPLLAPLELAVALGLLLPWLARWAALAAALLLGAFVLAMVRQLAKGQAPVCNCFGQGEARPIGWTAVLRNLLLLAAALYLVSAGAALGGLVPTLLAAASGPDALWWALGVVTVGLLATAWLGLQLLQQQGRLLLRIDNLEQQLGAMGVHVPVTGVESAPQLPTQLATQLALSSRALQLGAAAPPFVARSLGGSDRSLNELLGESSGAVLLLFAGAQCAPCQELAKEMLKWRRQDGLAVAWATVATGDAPALRLAFPGLAPERVLLQAAHEINELYGVVASPSAVWIEADATVGSSLAIGRDAIQALFHRYQPKAAEQRAVGALKPA